MNRQNQTNHTTEFGAVILEVLFAVLIFSLVMGALMSISTQAVYNSAKLPRLTCAVWLADNRMTHELLTLPQLVVMKEQAESSQCGEQWHWELIREPITDNRFYQITVNVYDLQKNRIAQRQLIRAY